MNSRMTTVVTIMFLPALMLMHGIILVAPAGAKEAKLTLPDELKVLMEGFRDNQRRIASISFNATFRRENPKWMGYTSRDGKQYGDQLKKISFWQNGTGFRLDVETDRQFDPLTKAIVYHVPYGEQLLRSPSEQEKEAVIAKYGVPKAIDKYIVLKDVQYEYYHADGVLNISSPRKLHENAFTTLSHAGLAGGAGHFCEYFERLQHNINKDTSLTSSIRVQELGNGLYSIRVTNRDENDQGELIDEGRLQLVVDSGKGYTIQSMRGSTKKEGDVVDRTYQYRDCNGVWVLIGMTSTNKNEKTFCTVDETSLIVNKPIDPSLFRVESLAIRKGTLVKDFVKQKEYLFNDIPVHLKGK